MNLDKLISKEFNHPGITTQEFAGCRKAILVI